MYGQKLNFKASTAASKAKQLIEENEFLKKPLIGAEMYNEDSMINKMEKDASFLNSLILEGSENGHSNLELLVESTYKLFKEVDLKPRMYSTAADLQELTESETHDLYGKILSTRINNSYSIPLSQGHLLEENKDVSKQILESALQGGVTDIDAELFVKYAIFENTLLKEIKNISIPEELNEHVNIFISAQSADYFKTFEENAQVLFDNIEEASHKLVEEIAPNLFIKSLTENSEISLETINGFVGASRLVK